MVVQWLGLHAFTAEDWGSIPGWGTKILQAAWHGQKKRETLARSLMPSGEQPQQRNSGLSQTVRC